MSSNSLKLLTARRFAPLFITQFLTAFNDNLFRTAIVTFITYQTVILTSDQRAWFVTISMGLFMLPFFIFSATAGQLADKYCKAHIIRTVKFFEVIIMALAVVSFTMQNPYLLLLVLFLVGTQSAFFGPIKYSILPDHLDNNELVGGSGLVEGGTIIAILVGTILGGIMTTIGENGAFILAVPLVLLSALSSFIISQFIPGTKPSNPNQRIDKDILNVTLSIVRETKENHSIFLLILGISWFWLMGSVILSQMPTFISSVVYANNNVFSFMLAVYTLSLGIGSVLCPMLCRSKITAKFLPLSCLFISIFLLDFAYVGGMFPAHEQMYTLKQFIHEPLAWRLIFDTIAMALSFGLYIVPLYTILLVDSKDMKRSQVVASNNIVNAFFIVTACITTIILLNIGFTIPSILKLLAFINLFVLLYICKLLPHTFIKSFFKTIVSSCFKFNIHGMENYHLQKGKGTIIVVNHVSMWDIVFITLFLPERFVVAMNPLKIHKWIVSYWFDLFNLTLLDPTDKTALKSLTKYLEQGQKVVIFPEGRPTTTGAVMKIDPELSLLATRAETDLLPICLSGAENSFLSQVKVQSKKLFFPEISMDILPVRQLKLSQDLTTKRKLALVEEQLYDLLTAMKLSVHTRYHTLLDALITAKKKFSRFQPVVNDATQIPMTYFQLILRSFILGKTLKKHCQVDEHVGLMLPNLNNTVVSFFAIQFSGAIPAMINFTHGIQQIISCCRTAHIKTIITAKAFIEKANLQSIVTELDKAGYKIIYLEDLRDTVTITTKLSGIVGAIIPKMYHRYHQAHRSADSTAVVLFTSGSEGSPKAVALSHRNIQVNRDQLTGRIDFNAEDRIFNSLPMFHSFGLSTGTILPLLLGVPLFLYPSPKHFRLIPQYAYQFNATVMFGTDTFLSNYCKYAHPYDFYRVRYVFCGAEKLRDCTATQWFEKFGLRIYQGYGATETSPALSNNSPMHFKTGSVGKLLPGINYKLKPVQGIEEGGELCVSGPNIMLGYLDETGKPTKGLVDGWYHTGDIVTIDDEGFVFIRGRAKRFAKIAGEMVSLMEAEVAIGELWPDNYHAICVGDQDGHEVLHLVTDYPSAKRADLVKHFSQLQLQAIMVPKHIHIVEEMPLLGSGKIDFKAASKLIDS